METDAGFAPIYGTKVMLRVRDPAMLKEYYLKRLQKEVLQWADVWPDNPSYEEVRLSFFDQERSSKEWRLWIFTLEGKLIGEVSLFDINTTKQRAEFGIVLFDQNYWGKGYGTQAAGLFLTDACRRFNLQLFYLFTGRDNKRAIRSFEKLGFRITEQLSMENERFVRMELLSQHLPSST